MMCTANELVQRGWSGGTIRKFLPTPDSVSPVPTYDLDRVKSIEQTSGWQTASVRSQTTRYEMFYKETLIDGITLNVPIASLRELRMSACESYNMYHHDIGFFKKATLQSDPAFLDRITVNHLRHLIGEYEQMVMQRTDYIDASDIVYKAIKQTYPVLMVECDRQMAKRRGSNR